MAFKAGAQNTWLRVEQGAGTPAFNPNSPAPKQGYVFKDTISGNWSIWISGTSWKPTNLFSGATPVFVTGSVTTLAPNTPASGAVRSLGDNKYAIDLGVPAGIQGLKGDKGDSGSGSGGGVPGFLSPDDFKAKHSTQLISSSDVAFFSSVGATTSDTYDWAAWQMCLNICDKKAIVAYSYYYWSRPEIKPSLFQCVIIGNNARAISTGNWTGTMLTTAMPTSFSDAEARNGAGANFVISNFRFEGTLNQIAFQPYATSDNVLTNVSTAGFKTGILLQFCLGGIYDNITCLNGTNGLLLSYGGYPNDTPIDSRFPTCNGSKIRNYHAVNITNIGIANYGAYDVEMNIKAIEGSAGGTINRAIDIDDMGNTGTKNFTITSGDFEGITIATGTGNAYLHLKTVVGDSRTVISCTNMHTSGIYIWADGQNNPCIILDRVNWIITSPCLVNFGYTWQFNYCSAFPFPSAIAGQFSSAGTLVTACNPVNGQPTYNAQGCGANHFNYTTQGK